MRGVGGERAQAGGYQHEHETGEAEEPRQVDAHPAAIDRVPDDHGTDDAEHRSPGDGQSNE